MIPFCISKSKKATAPINISIGAKKLRSFGFSGTILSLPERMSIFSESGGAKGPPAATLSYAPFIGPILGITPKTVNIIIRSANTA